MPMKDRLTELQQQMELGDLADGQMTRIHNGGFTSTKDDLLQTFLFQAGAIEVKLNKIKDYIAEIKKLQQHMLSNPLHDRQNLTLYRSLEQQVISSAAEVGDSLKQLKNTFQTEGLPVGSALDRVHTQRMSSLTTLWNLLTEELFAIRSEYADKFKSNLQRQLEIKGNNAQDAEISTILDTDSYSVFTNDYLRNIHEAEQTLRDLEGRKTEIIALEKSITEVNSLFKDMNLLVASQGETISKIEVSVNNTAEYTAQATTQLNKAKKYQSMSRRKILCIVIVVFVILIIIAIILAIIFGRK